jgi:hypothetical protein
MEFLALFIYCSVNLSMTLFYLLGRGKFYEFPFWAGVIALGWFLPQAIGGYIQPDEFPDGAYVRGLLFATLCTVALWGGYVWARNRTPQKTSWLNAAFYNNKLFIAGAVLCLVGFYFDWKLSSLPDEMLTATQWSGASVMYYFLSRIFRYGFIALWLLYLSRAQWFSPMFLVFLIPCWLQLLDSALLQGRRAAMMDLVSYLAVSLWLVRRISIPRWLIISGLCLGLLLVNAIGTYRGIMIDKKTTTEEKIESLMEADLLRSAQKSSQKTYLEFKNYIFYSQTYADTLKFDYGLVHWNGVVFNYVPAQIVGRRTKNALMVSLFDPVDTAHRKYGHAFSTGTTNTGYCDAFGSFGWLGFIKFLWVGTLMGILYRNAINGAFLGQLLYVMLLTTAMHIVSHGTNRILVSEWVYFFALCYPLIFLSRVKYAESTLNHDQGNT